MRIPQRPAVIGLMGFVSETISGAVDAATTTVQYVRVDHCRAHVFVTQEFLNWANLVTVLKQVSGERMGKSVALAGLDVPPFARRL